MALFGDDKREINEIKAELKKKTEQVGNLSKEVKQLRKEVELLSDLCKRNERKSLDNEEAIGEIKKTRV